MFQVITEREIKQTRDNSTGGTLYWWIDEIAGAYEAINVQSWSELAAVNECYDGDGFKVVCIDSDEKVDRRILK